MPYSEFCLDPSLAALSLCCKRCRGIRQHSVSSLVCPASWLESRLTRQHNSLTTTKTLSICFGCLLRDGFIVHTATNGRDAKELIGSSKPTDIVLTDLMLPYVSGFELITQIREDRQRKDVPVIVHSGKITERDAVRALDIGANDYVTKPYKPQELSARIKRHLNLQRRARLGTDWRLIQSQPGRNSSGLAGGEHIESLRHDRHAVRHQWVT